MEEFKSTLAADNESHASVTSYSIPEIKDVGRESASRIPMQTVYVDEASLKNGFGVDIPKNICFKTFSMQNVRFKCPHCGIHQYQSDAALYPILPVIFCFVYVPHSVYYTPRFTDNDERVTEQIIANRKDTFSREWHRDLAHELKPTILEFHKVGMCSKIIYLPILTRAEIRDDQEVFESHAQLAMETKRLGMVNYLVFESNVVFQENRIPMQYRATPSGNSPVDIRNTIAISMSNYICAVIMDIPWEKTFCLYLGGKIQKLDWAHALFNRYWIQNGITFGTTESFAVFCTRNWQAFVCDKLTSYMYWLKSPFTLSDIVSRPENKKMYYPPVCNLSAIMNQGETYIMTPTIVEHSVKLLQKPNILQSKPGFNVQKISHWLKQKISWIGAENIHNGIVSWLGFVIVFLGMLVISFMMVWFMTRRQVLLKKLE